MDPPSPIEHDAAAGARACLRIQERRERNIWVGDEARFTVLHVDAEQHSDFNENSIVVRVDLGDTSLLLTGDAESGPREPPSSSVTGAEAYLLEHHRDAIDADILQVGHHGSMTGSRLAFLRAVSPGWALVGARVGNMKPVSAGLGASVTPSW